MDCKMEYSPTITLEAAGTAEDRVFYLLPVPVLKADLVWQKIKMSACIQSANLTQAKSPAIGSFILRIQMILLHYVRVK